MFSRKEREYLQRVLEARPPSPSAAELGLAPGYRRKLKWSIRRKASRALTDWQLYASALEADPKGLALRRPPEQASVPLTTDPFVTASRAVASALRRISRGR